MSQRPQRIAPGPGQESVWDYPRPPAVEPSSERVRVVHGGVVVADTTRAIRVLETSQPPAYYLPRTDVRTDLLRRTETRSVCEWKGAATYWSLVLPDADPDADAGDGDGDGDGDGGGGGSGDVVADVAWSYEHPTGRFASIAGHLAFYAQRVDACWVDDERVQPNPGSFYGGWITSRIVGPFKGAPGTSAW